MHKLGFNPVTIDVLHEVARDIIAVFEDKKVVLFYGEMGSGKTTLARQLGVRTGAPMLCLDAM